LGPALTANSLLDFINAEGNILLALSGGSPTPNAIGSFLLELDLVLSPDRAPLIVDHFNYDTLSAKDDHDVLLLERPGALRQGLKSFFAGDGIIAFPRAAGQAFGISSELVAPILRAPPTAYSYDKKAPEGEVDDTFATGSQVALVSAMQARNNARLSVVGSVESLQDRWFDVDVQRSHDAQSTKTLNREFAKQVTAWTFQEAGVLKAGEVKHYQQTMDGLVEPANASGQLYPLYRVKSDV
ncbi:oligosaccharyl transferase glycoprotein complex, beta subunit, partial [Ascosphaera atra]